MNYKDQLAAEARSWTQPDVGVEDKKLRERIRHPKLIRDLLLDRLPTHRMDILEVGGGPWPVSDLLPFRCRVVVDPCTDSYRTIAPCPHHVCCEIEDYAGGPFDLVIATNSLDHVRDVDAALRAMNRLLRPGGYMAIQCAQDNALHHPHPAHKINLTPADLHRALDETYETVHELTWERDRYRYGWVLHDGRRGQPSMALLFRKCVAS